MKKVIFLLPILFVIPAFAAKNSTRSTITPTGNTVRNQDQVQTQNQGEDSQLMVNTRESEQLQDRNIPKLSPDEEIEESSNQVLDQIKSLETITAKGRITVQVDEISQNQAKNQQQIKSDLNQLKSQSKIRKILFGSDQAVLGSLEAQMAQNHLTIENLEELKNQTQNQAEIDQLQLTIDLMIYQNTSLESKINREHQSRGLFGWFKNLF